MSDGGETTLREASFKVRGTKAYIQPRWGGWTVEEIGTRQEGPGSLDVSTEGWLGVRCSVFTSAMVSACRMLPGFKANDARLQLFVLGDGLHHTLRESVRLVRLTGGAPERIERTVCDSVRARWLFPVGWEAILRIRYCGDLLSLSQVVDMLTIGGRCCGIGEGRPGSHRQFGAEYGTFEVIGTIC